MTESETIIRKGVFRWGELFFRYRSFTPIPLALLMVAQARVSFPAAFLGLALMVSGEWIRLASVRAAGKSTRTREVGAAQLVTWGLYAYTRNPLYMGNFLLWIGAALYSGGAWMYVLLAGVGLMFALQYTLIITLEEATLAELFGQSYSRYREVVPRVIPRFRKTEVELDSLARPSDPTLHPWRYAIESERRTLQVSGAVIFLAWLSSWAKI